METGDAKRQGCSNDIQSTYNFLVDESHAANISLLLCRQTKRSISFLFAYHLQFRLTERR